MDGRSGPNYNANTFLNRAKYLVDHIPNFRELAQTIKDVSKDHARKDLFANGTDVNSLNKDPRMNEVRAKLRSLFVQMNEGVPLLEPVLPPPPNASELYYRIEKGTEVTDIGSGDCRRLRVVAKELKITAIDKQEPEQLKADVNFVKQDIEELETNNIVTSFNVVTQLTPAALDVVENQDGVHIMPDVKYILDEGMGKLQPDSTGRNICVSNAISRGGSVQQYRDYPYKGKAPQLRLVPGYVGVNFYKKREIEMEINFSKTYQDDYIPTTPKKIAEHILATDDLSPKIDGEFHELELEPDGSGRLTRRNGRYYKVTHNHKGHSCLWLERVGDVFVLVRVELYRGITPFHSGPMIRYFCNRVKFKEKNGCSIVPTPPMEENGCAYPSDGIVCRMEENDYFYKPVVTFDLCLTKDDIALLEDQTGMHIKVHGKIGSLIEYKIEYLGADNLVFKCVKKRSDKLAKDPLSAVIEYIGGLFDPDVKKGFMDLLDDCKEDLRVDRQ